MFTYSGGHYYHPVQIAQRALAALERYRLSGGEDGLVGARNATDRLLEESVPTRDALFFPYPFDFALAGNPDDAMLAPWYSGMAQGQALSLLARLHAVTNVERYRSAATAVLKSFRVERSETEPWVAFVDAEGYLWLEEYAKDPPMMVLNGHIFAMFGIYDYILRIGDMEALDLFEGAAATIVRYGEEFRDPGQVSRYCLRVPSIKNTKYHVIHQQQLRLLSQMSGEPYFASLADRMAFDYPSLLQRAETFVLRAVGWGNRRLRRHLSIGRRSFGDHRRSGRS